MHRTTYTTYTTSFAWIVEEAQRVEEAPRARLDLDFEDDTIVLLDTDAPLDPEWTAFMEDIKQ